ncbi:murein peptide amidase A [bacterium]|nr:murein peptide amidase A [bacterium]
MKHQVLSKTVEGRAIELYSSARVGSFRSRVLIKAGVHGDEPEGVQLLERFLKEKYFEKFHQDAFWSILPTSNPDGVALSQRVNANGVDLNRNFPSSDWSSEIRASRYHPGPHAGSELETQNICRLVEQIRPSLIISLHNYQPMVNVNGDCGVAAEVLARLTGYPITNDMGYETPGSFGRWAWEQCKVPTITLEIEDKVGIDAIWPRFGEALVEAVNAHTEALH